MNLIRSVWSVLRLGVKWTSIVILMLLAAVVGSLATAATNLVFGLATSVVEMVIPNGGIRSHHLSEMTHLQTAHANQLTDLRRSHADELSRARAPVRYRGGTRSVKDAVRDTTDRVSRRVASATARNIAILPGEALPYVGVTVAVAATAWEVNDACALMNEMAELAAAFDVGVPDERDKVCGQSVPSSDEIWQVVLESPQDVWNAARNVVGDIPTLSQSVWETISEFFSRIMQ